LRYSFLTSIGPEGETAMTTILVRAQARGGKFLGKAVASTPPTLTVLRFQNPIPPDQIQQFTTADSGLVVAQPGADTTQNPIVVDPNPNPSLYVPHTNYLQPATSVNPPEGDSYALVKLLLTPAPADYTFAVTAYDTDTGSAVHNSVTVPLSTETKLPEVGIVVSIDGLRITAASATRGSNGVQVTANIAMMCGCEITPVFPPSAPAEPYWPASEFTVKVLTPDGNVYPMTCDSTFSVFNASIPSQPSGTALTINAVQDRNGLNRNKVTVKVS